MSKIVVHGVHRSGTSFWASLLEKAGCWYAEDEYRMPPQKDNPRGFWERTDVVEVNDRILSSAGLIWFTLNPRIEALDDPKLRQYCEQEIQGIVGRLDKHENWFLKDPRLSITWPRWAAYIQPTHHLVVHRHPISVAKSLNRRNGISVQHGLIFWYHQTRMIAKSLLSEKNVINVQFSANDSNADRWLSIINNLFSTSESNPKLKLNDVDSLFESKLVNHQNTNENTIGEKAKKVYDLVSIAWGHAIKGEFAELLELPEYRLDDFSWEDLDSKYIVSILSQKLENEVLQYQNEARNLSYQVVEFADEFSLERNSLNSHIEFLDKELVVKGQEIRTEQQEVKIKSKQLKSTENQLKSTENQLKLTEEELKSTMKHLGSQQEVIDELNSSLLSIAGILKRYMNSKRYFLFNSFNKVMGKFGLLKYERIHDALDIAKFGHSESDLERVMPRESARVLLLVALVKNPIEFITKFNISRLRKGLRVVFGIDGADREIQQALRRYHRADKESITKLDIFDPDEPGSWRDNDLRFTSNDKPTVSIVIPVYNNYLTTLACLHSIKKNTDSDVASYEVIIADDCSTDQTCDIAANIEGLRVVRPTRNLGFLKNCNHAMQAAKGEFIVLLNNDTNVQSCWLPELLSPLVADRNVGVTGPMFLYPDGRLQEAGGIIFSDASGWNYGRLDKANKPEYNFARNVDYVSGACLMFRKSLWDKVGGFDEVFAPAYYEDTDFCFEVRELGLDVRFIPTSKVVHFEGVSHGSSEDSGIKKYQAVNREKFSDKWADRLNSDHFPDSSQLFLARTHGRHKKTLLFIDHYVPFYDKDAGSKVAQRYIELLVEQGIRVIFLGDNFYPHQPYTGELQALGVEVLHGNYYKDHWYSWLQENSVHIDSIYLNRPHISKNYIDKIRALAHVPYIAYHGADLHYVRVAREELLGIESGDGMSSEDWKKIEFDIMRKCDVSLWLSENEVELIEKEDKSLNLAYKPMHWFEPSDIDPNRKIIKNNNLLFVGGFGHPPNLDGLQWFLDQVYPVILQRFSDVNLKVIGSNCPDSIQSLQSENINILGFVSEEELAEAYRNSRVSIVPLRYGAGVKGKVIESMQHGVTVMTTTIGAEGLPGEPVRYLNIEDDPKAYAKRLIQLLESDDVCSQKVALSDQALLRYFSRSSAIKAINKILGSRS